MPSTNPVQWMTSPLQHSSMTAAVASPKVAVANCLSNRTLSRESVQSWSEETKEESSAQSVDSTSTATAGLINAQQYLSQIYYLRQQAMAAALNRETTTREMDSQDVERSLPTPTNYSDSDKVKSLLQTFVTSAGNNNLLFSYNCQLPWPAASLAAIAATQKLPTAATSNPETNICAVQPNKISGAIDPILGNLLPPPPSLPVGVSNPSNSAIGRRLSRSPVSLPTTSHSEKNLSPSRSSRLNITSVSIPHNANLTSRKERSQPLDLSVTTRQRLEEAAATTKNQNGVSFDAAGRKLPISAYSRPVLAANITNNNNLSSHFGSYRPKEGSSSPTKIQPESTQTQHVASSSSLIQSNQLTSIPLTTVENSSPPESLADMRRESFQKWIHAAQHHQQAMVVQAGHQQQGKRPSLVSLVFLL